MKKYNVKVNGVTYEVEIEETGASAAPASETKSAAPAAPAAPAANVVTGDGKPVKAPMPGTINSIKCSVGDSVKKGDVLLVLEAMKMENEIMAPSDGTVKSIGAKVGDSVKTDDILVTIG